MTHSQDRLLAVMSGLLAALVWGCGTVHAADSLTSVMIMGKKPVAVNARIDDHTTLSSLSVSDLQYIPRSDGTIVEFVVGSDAMVLLPRVTFRRPLIRDREARVPNGGIRHEPVVTLDVCVAGHYIHKLPFVLITQQGYTPPMILSAREVPKNTLAQPKGAAANQPLCQH